MKYAIIILGGLFISLIALVLFFYFQFEIPKQEEITSRIITFNIAAFDKFNNDEQIITGYTIKVDNTFMDSQTTATSGRILFTVFVNKTIEICNNNLDNQKFYIFCYKKDITDLTPDNNRADLILLNPGELIINQDSNLGDKDKIILNISTSRIFKNPIICLKWSSRLFGVNTVFKVYEKEERYISYDKCYDLEKDITNDTSFIPINYRTIDKVTSSDFIKVVFIDRDNSGGNLVTIYNNTNVGADDTIYEIKYIAPVINNIY